MGGSVDTVPSATSPAEQLPIVSGPEQRDPATGRFLPGNTLTPTRNPYAKQAGILRSELFSAVTRERLRAVIDSMLDKAENGNVQAAKLVLSYTLGEPEALDLIQTVAKLQAVVLHGTLPSEES